MSIFSSKVGVGKMVVPHPLVLKLCLLLCCLYFLLAKEILYILHSLKNPIWFGLILLYTFFFYYYCSAMFSTVLNWGLHSVRLLDNKTCSSLDFDQWMATIIFWCLLKKSRKGLSIAIAGGLVYRSE